MGEAAQQCSGNQASIIQIECGGALVYACVLSVIALLLSREPMKIGKAIEWLSLRL
jgi:hypothetical protein